MDKNVYFAAAANYDQQTVDAAVERLFCQLPAAQALGGKRVLLPSRWRIPPAGSTTRASCGASIK